MNKNLKVISSLAMAGILAATGISTVSAATTKSLGVYRKIVEGKAVVPYVLEKASDKVDVKDLNSEFGVTLSSGTVVKTGTTFKKAGEPHTVVVYGDVKDDGKVNVNDVTTLVDAVANGTKLDEFQKEAADVRHDGKVNVNDITTLVGYIANGDALNIKLTAEDATNTGYTLTVGTNNVVNNQNSVVGTENLKLVVDVENSKISNTAKTLVLNVYDADGTVVKDNIALGSLAANSNKAEIKAKDLKTDLGIEKDGTENGTYTFELIDATNTKKVVLARTDVNVKILTPAAAKVNVTRTSATAAALSLEGYGEGKIVSVEFKVEVSRTNDATPVITYSKSKTISNVNNKLTNKELDYVLPDGNTTMELVLTDEFGNKATVSNVGIPKYGATAQTAVAKVKAPVLKNVSVAEFEFLDKDNNAQNVTTGEAVLYDGNGKIVAKQDITTSKNKVDFTSSMNKAGKYKVGVIIKGNGNTTTDSAETLSDVVEVKELNAITNIKFNVTKDGDKVITFEDSNKKELLDTTTANSSEYTITFEELDGTNGYITPATAPSITLDATKHTITMGANFKANTIYKVTINANADNTNQLEYVSNTNPTVSDSFFYIDASSLLGDLASKTDHSLTYELDNPITVNGTDATYKAEVNKVLKEANNNDYTLEANKEIKNAVVTTENGNKYLTIEGLAENQRYVVKIIATVGDMQGESGLVGYASNSYATAPTTYLTAPAIDGFKVVKGNLTVEADKAKAVAKTLFVNQDGKVVVNGDVENPITLNAGSTINNNYAPEFNDILKFASGLIENDKITVNDSKVTLSLTEDKSASGDTVTIPATTLEGKEVEVIGNGIASDRTITVTSGAKLSKLSVGGNGLILALTNNDTDTPVYLNNGAEVTVTTQTNVVLVKGANATINGVVVNTTKANVTLQATATAGQISVVTPKGVLDTNLTFTNRNDGRYGAITPEITFIAGDATSEIIGTVTINSTEGKVTVTKPSGNIDYSKVNLKIDVKDADVDIVGFTDSANVNVTLETTEKATGVADNKVEAVLGKDKLDLLDKLTTKVADNDSVILQKYADNEDIVLSTTTTTDIPLVTTEKKLTGEDKKLMQEFINSFGINNENVTMTFDDISAGEVTITVAGDTKVNLSGFTTYSNK